MGFLKETASRDVTMASNFKLSNARAFSVKSGGWDGDEGSDRRGKIPETPTDLGWDVQSSWSLGLTKEHFDGEAIGHQIDPTAASVEGGGVPQSVLGEMDEIDRKLAEFAADNRKAKGYVDGWGERMRNISVLLKQIREPGARGSYLKDSEKAEMYRLHKENPEVYTIEKLAKDYRIMRQRVHAILWLKEDEEEEEKKLGRPLDDSVELLLDTCPE